MQMSGVLILLVSAKVYTGAQHALITSYLGDRFDEKGADLIRDGVFALELDGLQLAMGCYPAMQIALYLFFDHQLPMEVTAAPIVEAVKNVKP